jgi:uncharacterized protein with HEPN domain
MSKRSNKVYLEDILESINCIFDYLGDKTEFEFMQSLLIQDAVTRRFEIIGEASSKIDVDYKLKYPEIEWNLMKDMRNKLIHEYFGVSNSTIYNTVHLYLPSLKEKLEKLISEYPE